jgi:ABC-type multidrug transport system permease subunit
MVEYSDTQIGQSSPKPLYRPSFGESAIVQLTFVRLLEFLREPEAVFWIFIFPILLTAGLGLAFRNRSADVIRVGAATPELRRALGRETLLDTEQLSPAEGRKAIQQGRIAIFVEPRPGGGVIYQYDDTNPDGRTARILADRAVQRDAGRVDPVAAGDRIIREPGARYIDFLVPGLLGMNLMGSGIWGVGFAIVDARRKRLLKRLIATPMPKHDYLLSIMLSRLITLVIEVGVILGFSVIVFRVPLRGSPFVLAALCLLGSLCFAALGLLIACRVKTIEAASGLMNAVMMPMWIVSGVFFSARRFPDLLQPLIKWLPLTAIVDALRANMLQGASLARIGPQIEVLAAWFAFCFSLALLLLRWR